MANNDSTQGCIGCLVLIFFGLSILLLFIYLLSDGSIDAVENATLEEMFETPTCQYCPRLLVPLTAGYSKKDRFIGLLKKDINVTQLSVTTMKPLEAMTYVAKKYRKEEPRMLSMIQSMSKYDLDEEINRAEYQDAVVVTFVHKGKTQFAYVFFVIKGHYWKILKSAVTFDGEAFALRPWATYGELILASSSPI